MSNTSSNNTTASTTTSVFPRTRIALAIQETLHKFAPFQVKSLEQELTDRKMVVSIEAETPTDREKSVGIRGTFTVPNDLDCILIAQWEGCVNVLCELNDMINSKRIRWEQQSGYEPRHFENESIEVINKGIQVVTNTELSELGISTGKYKFRFEIRTIRNNSTLTELKIEGFAHMNMR